MFVKIHRHGAVEEIVLSAPDIRNAIGPDDARDIRLALTAANEDPEVHAVVLSAEGSVFCAGGNLPEIMSLVKAGPDAVRERIYAEFQGMARVAHELRVPLLTAVDGGAIGLGCDLALMGDLTYIGPDGFLSQGWAAMGLVPAPGGTRLAMRRGGPMTVWRLLAEGRVGPEMAERLNLGIASPNARTEALAAAKRLAALPPEAIEATRQLIEQPDFETHLASALDFQSGFLTSPAFARRAEAALRR